MVVAFLMILSTTSFAQNQPQSGDRCGSQQWLENMFREYPAYRQWYETAEKKMGEEILRKKAELIKGNNGQRTNAIVTMPVVFHVVLPATGTTSQATITDAMINAQLTKLNQDYSGLNADSTNGSPFYSVRGHSELRFCLAQRTPTNQPTNGIDRVVSSTVSNSSQTNDPIKSTAAGGADAWDPNKYINIWVGNFTNTSLLGYATFPIGSPEGGAPLNQQGVVILAQSVPGGTAAPYNGGRTLTHELGHFFWLRHINGDGTCLDDFPNTPGIDDTPTQSNLTSGCPTGTQASGCSSPTPPGRMYQNYMDYTDDACMTMFTNGQGTRMMQAITSYRPTLMTSNGCTPPVVLASDASISAITNPTTNQGFCGATSVTPIVQLSNFGSTTLTSATITTSVDGGAPTNYSWSGSVASFGTPATVTLPNVTGLTPGNHTLTICVINPNTGTDLDATNNCKAVSFSIISGSSGGALPPISEGFEGATYPSPGWSLTTPTGQAATTPANWEKVTNSATFVAKTGTSAIRAKWWTWSTGRVHFLNLPVINFAPGNFDNAFMTFHYAFKAYSATAGDSLAVQVSTDCGTTWVTLWERGQQGLATASGFATGEYGVSTSWPVTAGDWTQTPININLNAYRNGPIYLRFRARSGFGNNLYLDDINIIGTNAVNNDAQVTAINSPIAEFCGTSFTPQVVVKNLGLQPLTSVSVGYRVNNTVVAPQAFTLATPLATNATTTLTLTLPYTGPLNNGSNTIRAYTTLPNGVADQQSSNDSLSKTFIANLLTPLPVVEGFESTTFPPAGWNVINPNAGSITWVRSTASSKSGSASAMIDYYNYATTGHLDYLRSPLVKYNPAYDSSLLTFQYAYKPYSATFSDTLEVVVSTDCGATWSAPVWRKGGAELASAAGFNTSATWAPTAAEWTKVPVVVDMSAYKNSGNIFIAIRGKNGYGQKLYVDDINIYEKLVPDYDLTITDVVSPYVEICDVPFTPVVTVANVGKVTTTSLRVNYTIDGGAVVSQTFTGLNVARNGSVTLSLNPITSLSTGAHTFKFYTSLPNGVADQAPANDSANVNTVVKTSVAAPLVESFEGTTFPPTGWELVNPNADRTWEKFTAPKLVASDASSVAGFRNRNYTLTGRVDYLTSPVIKFGTNDSTILRFDVSAVAYQYPGSTSIPLDTLEVQSTIDCGRTWTTIYKKWGDALQTINDPNYNYVDSFFSNAKSQWRTDSINLGTTLAGGGTARIRFKNTGFNGNNIFIDKINLYAKTLAARLKTNGFIIVPNPVQNVFVVQHYLAPTNLRGIGFYNSAGQRLMYQSYNGNADSYIPFDISRFAAGVYMVKLEYTNKTVTERIIKL